MWLNTNRTEENTDPSATTASLTQHQRQQRVRRWRRASRALRRAAMLACLRRSARNYDCQEISDIARSAQAGDLWLHTAAVRQQQSLSRRLTCNTASLHRRNRAALDGKH
jgi:hypothetical protein